MTERDPQYLTEEEAVRLWHRAAQLQAEAAQRAEVRAEERDPDTLSDGPREGYALTHVRTAALEAGIADEFVEAALADVRLERALPDKGKRRNLARRFLGDPDDAITVRRVIEASPSDVLAAMEAILPDEPYRLSLTERRGDPLDGGVLSFDIQGSGFSATEGFAGDASAADLRQVYFSIVPVAGAGDTCEVTVRGPVAWAFNINTAIGGVIVGVGGGLGVGVGSGLAGALGALGAATGLGTVVAIAAVVTVMLTTVGGAALGLHGFRALYGYTVRKGGRALAAMLEAIAVRAQGGWGITAPPDPAQLPPLRQSNTPRDAAP